MGECAANRRPTPASAAPRASEALWRTYRDQLLRFIRRNVDDAAAAEDLLHEVFLRMYRHLDRLQGHDNPRAWLYRVARSAIIDDYRARRPADRLPEALAAPEPERGDEVVTELAACLSPMIQRLPPIYREAVQRSEIEGLTQREVAER